MPHFLKPILASVFGMIEKMGQILTASQQAGRRVVDTPTSDSLLQYEMNGNRITDVTST